MITLDIATNVADTLHDSLGQYKVLSHVATTLLGPKRLSTFYQNPTNPPIFLGGMATLHYVYVALCKNTTEH